MEVFPTLGKTDVPHPDSHIYSEDLTTKKRSHQITNGVSLLRNMNSVEQKFRFTKKLCALGNLQFLRIFDTFFEVHKAVLRPTNSKGRGANVAWLQRLTFSERENAMLYEALFNDKDI